MINYTPLISIIIRTYNTAHIVREAIESVIKQAIDSKLYEILIIDDGSTDNTKKKLQPYLKKIKLITQLNRGHVKSVNIGIKKARGEYFILLDSDDLFCNGILKKMVGVVKKNKKAAFVYCDYFEQDAMSGKKRKISLAKNLFSSVAGGILFKKEIIKKMGLYDKNLIFAEYDLLLKLLRHGYVGVHIAEPLFIYRRRHGSLTSNKICLQKAFSELKKKYGPIKGLRKY